MITDGVQSFSVGYQDFISNKFWLTFRMEKAAGESTHTGTNTMGSIVYLNFQGLGTSVNQIHVVCQFDAAACVTAGGVELKF